MYSHNLNYIHGYEKGNKRTIIFIISEVLIKMDYAKQEKN